MSKEGSGEPAQMHTLNRIFSARIHNIDVDKNFEQSSDISTRWISHHVHFKEVLIICNKYHTPTCCPITFVIVGSLVFNDATTQVGYFRVRRC